MAVKFTKKQIYSTGGSRDDNAQKIKYHLFPTWPVAKSIAIVATEGAKNHGDRNWEKGIPYSRLIESAIRHLNQFLEGLDEEDHLTMSIINLIMLKHFILIGRKDLDDLPKYEKENKI